MVGASKILTVSYGTFSCTLEGFDDPFNTMRAIAEYFRDLAAEDRFFGATPPTPDADMLHRIAEREVQRRVEARVSDHGIVLRARDEAGAATAAPLAEVPRAPVAEPAPVAPMVATSAAALATAAVARAAEPAAPEADYEDLAEAEAADETAVFAPAAEPAAEATIDDMGDVAAKLSRIRAVIAAAQAAKVAPAPTADEAVFERAQESARAAFDEEPAAEADFDAAAAIDDDFGFELELDDFPVSRPAAPEAAPVLEQVTELAAEAEVTAAATEVAEPEEPAAPEVEAAMADLADEAEGADEAALPEEIEDLTGEEAAAEAEPADALLSDEDMDDEDYAALAVATLMGAEDGVAADAAMTTEVDEDLVAGDDAGLDALDLADWRVEADEEEDTAGDEEIAEDFAEDEADAAAAAQPEAEPAERRPGFFERARARVIRIRRGAEPEAEAAEAAEDLEAEAAPPVAASAEGAFVAEVAEEEEEPLVLATAGAADTETEDEDEHAAIFAALTDAEDDAGRFDEDLTETDVQAEEVAEADAADEDADEDEAADEGHAAILAGIGAAISASRDEAETDEALSRDLAAMARDARRDSHEGRAILEDHAGDGEASVERLMEEAKSKLEGDESRRRFSAIAHLKAAVAATVADRKLKPQAMPTDQAGPEEDIDRYRDDLSKAVRPRRPVAEGTPATRRPALNDRPAPLVLVSEQRVDVPADEIRPAAVVRPRRIGATALSVSEVEEDFDDEAPLSPEEARSFAEFADRLGATNLAELLEAAAAYTATVEGLPHFSRPHILKKVSGYTEEDEFTREDGLRSFGMLLRQGKIQKISRGQFTITESSRFMEQARRVAH